MLQALARAKVRVLIDEAAELEFARRLDELNAELAPPPIADFEQVIVRWGYDQELGCDDALPALVASDFYHDLALRSKDSARITPKAVHNDRSRRGVW